MSDCDNIEKLVVEKLQWKNKYEEQTKYLEDGVKENLESFAQLKDSLQTNMNEMTQSVQSISSRLDSLFDEERLRNEGLEKELESVVAEKDNAVAKYDELQNKISKLFDPDLLDLLASFDPNSSDVASILDDSLITELFVSFYVVMLPFNQEKQAPVKDFVNRFAIFDGALYEYLRSSDAYSQNSFREKLSIFINNKLKDWNLQVSWPISGERFDENEQKSLSGHGSKIDQVFSAVIVKDNGIVEKAQVTVR